MRRTRAHVVVAATAAATLAGSVLAAAVAQAAPVPVTDADRYAPGMLHAMERDLGLAETEAVELMEFQAAANETVENLSASLAGSYAGSWIEGTESTTVAVTDAADVAAVEKAGAEAVVVEHSMDALDAWSADLGEALDGVRGAPSAYVDVEANRIVVGVHEGARGAVRQAVEQAGVPAGAVTYEVTDEQPRPLVDVVGGNAYYIGSGARCSVGFSVSGGFVTAGHCGSRGATTSQPSGSFQVSSFPGDDYGYVAVGSGNSLVPGVNGYDGNTYAVTGYSQAPVGTTVCRSGSTTGWHCGTVQALNATVNYAEGSVYGLIRTSVCAEPGDSGGSLLAGNTAQGMTSGGSGNCSSGGTTYFQPVGEALSAAGVSLLTY